MLPSSLRLPMLAGLLVLCASRPSSAESFTVTPLQYDQGWNLIGIESSGAVVVLDSYNLQYETFVNGALVSQSSTAPTSLDNGTACSPAAPSGFSVYAGRCNGSFEALDGWNYAANPNGRIPQLLAGSGAPDSFVANGGGGLVFMNSAGDLAWDDAYTDTIYEATNITPEPSSLLLLATGASALVAFSRRKLA